MKTLKKLKPQDAPFTIQVEPVEGCNLGCSFCGLRGMREKGTTPWNMMKMKTAERIADQVAEKGWTSKIVFAMHGEPTLHKNLFVMIAYFRTKLPNNLIYVISNGKGIVDSGDPLEYVRLLNDVGVNHLLLDNYAPNGDWSKIVEAVGDAFPILHLGKGVPMFSSRKTFDILVMPPIHKESLGFVRNLVNHAGAAAPYDYSKKDCRCTNPFRELSFRWDGNVSICCDDFRGQYPIANINDMRIEELWNHPRFQAARVLLYNNERSFRPCLGCNNVSMRVGLLPDRMGKESLPEPTKEVREFAQAVIKENAPLSSIIIHRKWEK